MTFIATQFCGNCGERIYSERWDDPCPRCGDKRRADSTVTRGGERSRVADSSAGSHQTDPECDGVSDGADLANRQSAAVGFGSSPAVAAPLSAGSHPNSNAPGRRREDDINLVATAFHQTQDPVNDDDVSPALGRTSIGMGVAYPLARRGRDGESDLEVGEANVYNALRAGDGGSSRLNQLLTPEANVRRLTPVECERLQAWPDNWTNPTGDAPDSRRYAACGDGVTSSVAEWIGRRLMEHT